MSQPGSRPIDRLPVQSTPLGYAVRCGGPLAFVFCLLSLLHCSGSAPSAGGAQIPETIAFNRDVRPILSDSCFVCHGTDANQRKADLRLDVREVAVSRRDGVVAIVPGDPTRSEVVRRITSHNAEERMPPADSNRSITPREIEILTRWIEQGAKYEEHWAFVPPVRPSLPVVENEAWVSNPIDRFVMAELESRGLAPVEDADRTTLLRRLSFDLTGLPPTPEEVDGFVRSQSDDAAAAKSAANRLLASPHYGERMATAWLDLVRFADTNGYNGDQHHDIYPYRDYVIRAFNSNKRFDQFTAEQLAGDLFKNATTEQRVASGYNRLNQVTTEVGAVKKEYTAKYAADRVRTTASVWLGATLGCAECHDHKFDPFTARDFYGFAAFFADIVERPVYDTQILALPPQMVVLEKQSVKHIQALTRSIERHRATLAKEAKARSDELIPAQASWEREVRERQNAGEAGLGHRPLVARFMDWTRVGSAGVRARTNSGFSIATAIKARIGVETAGVGAPENFALALDLSNLEFTENFQILNWDIRTTGTPGDPFLKIRIVHKISGDVELRAEVGEAIGSRVVHLGTGDSVKSLRLLVRWNEGEKSWRIAWGTNGEPPVIASHPPLLQIGPSPETWGTSLVFARGLPGTRFSVDVDLSLVDYRPELDDVSDEINSILDVEPDARTEKQSERLALAFAFRSSQFEQLRRKIQELVIQKQATVADLPQTLVSVAGPRRTTRVLPRGNWDDDSGEIVRPDTPAFLGGLPENARRDRLGLARWLVSPENPLTARTFVNRLWKLYFGRGIARTLDDLGSQGDWPTHRALLDWLAVEFVDSGWNVKHMVKLIVASHTYRLSSRPSPKLATADPENDWFGRQARYRLEAEMIRDNALAISGLLTRTISGPSVQPYQPEGYWANVWTFLSRDTQASKWQSESGEEQYRRGLYTYWKRSFPHPSLLAFDAPTREECIVLRARSNTPLQALVLLNDPTYVEAARAFAERIVVEGGTGVVERVGWAYRTALSRDPVPPVQSILEDVFERHLADYTADTAAAADLLAVGNRPTPSDLDPSVLAAWTSVARVIFNLHETTVRN